MTEKNNRSKDGDKQSIPDLPGRLDQLREDLGTERLLKLFGRALDATGEMVLITDARERIGNEQIIYVNKTMTEVTGYSREELLGENPRIFQGEETEKETLDELREKLTKGEHFKGETFNYRKDGSKYRVQWSIDPIRNSAGEITHYISVQQDVTEQWEKNKQLVKMVEQNNSLLKETHHRVKNNLAVIIGLLELQIANTDSDETKAILNESVNRIQSIATLHEKLYETGNFQNLSLRQYFSELLNHLESTLGSDAKEVVVETEIEEIQMAVNHSVPLALILNEVVTNAYKHAFSDRDRGTIHVSLQADGDRVRMEVTDNGIGLQEGQKVPEIASLGLRLIHTLSTQLRGEYSLENRQPSGTRFRLTFSLDD